MYSPPHFLDILVIILFLAFLVFPIGFMGSADEVDRKTSEESGQDVGQEDKAASGLKV